LRESFTGSIEPVLKAIARSALVRLLPRWTYTVRHGRSVGLRRRGGFGFIPAFLRHSSPEDRFICRLPLKGFTVYDVGGFEGVYSIFFARAVGHEGRVIVFEPNPTNAMKIVDNVAINGFTNVVLRELALGVRRGKTALWYDASDAGRGTLVTAGDSGFIGSIGRLSSIDVSVEALDDVIAAGEPPPDLVKIDVEGAEYDVLLGAQETLARVSPLLLIEVHGESEERKVENAQRVIALVEAYGYSAWHVETARVVSASSAHLAREGHLYCTPAAVESPDVV
jgi:FkbM family methyltransferase